MGIGDWGLGKTTDKKIIGKLILNDGQPCYRLDEKLWRHFL